MRFIFTILLLIPQFSVAEHVALQWTWDDSRKPSGSNFLSDFRSQWKDSCKEIGSLVRPGKGPYGWGIFDSFTCFVEDQRIFGPRDKSTRWLIKFHHHSGGLTLKFFAGPEASVSPLPAETQSPLSVVEIEHISDMAEIVGSEEFAPLLLATMWDQAPFLRTLKPKKSKYRKIVGPSPPLVDPFPLPPAPAKVRVFEMEGMTASGYWIGNPMNLGILESANVKYLHSGQSRSRPIWNFLEPFKADKKLWVHHDEGNRLMQVELQKRLKEAVDVIQDIGLVGAIAEALSMTVTSGYFGFRYGKSLVNQQFFETNMSMMSFLFEIRAGPLQGIKFFADIYPKFALPTGVEFEGNKQVLGWSFGMDVGPLYMDLTPTFGRWSVRMRLPDESVVITIDESTGQETTETFTEILPFDMNNSLVAGLEFGSELRFTSHLYRFGYSTSFALPMNGQTTSVSVSRIALDSFHALPLLEGVESSLLLFFMIEGASFTDSAASATDQTQETVIEDPNEQASFSNKITDVAFPFVFAGMGVTFSW